MQALVLRTLYNNRGWKDKCVSPFNDPLCWRCQDARKKIAQGKSIDLVFKVDQDKARHHFFIGEFIKLAWDQDKFIRAVRCGNT